MRKFVLILLIAIAAPRLVYADDAAAVKLLVGRSTIVDVGSAISRVSLTSADIADAVVTSANQLLVNGKMPGTISMYVWERSGGLRRYEIVVQRDLALLNDQFKRLFPGEAIEAQSSGKGIVLSGLVSNKEIFDKAFTVAGGYVEKADEVVNMVKIQESTASNQVLLRVRFAEVSRSAITNLWASLFTGATGYKDVLARSTTTTTAPTFDSSDPNNPKLVFSDFLNLFLFDAKHQLGTVIQALQTRGQFQSLAEPNLVAESGKEASFLAGGEFPVPIAQGSGASIAISVAYKEFGVRLNFTPVIHGDRVHLKVRPEVSTLDFANGVLLNGFRIPALSTRRTETEVDLLDGQTFAIAGLINNSMNNTLQKIPGIGDIPILGLLFKSKAANKEQTELVVMITPQILPRTSSGVTSTLPGTPEPFLAPIPAKKLVEPLPPAFTPARSGLPGTGAMRPSDGMPGSPAPATAPLAQTMQKADGAQKADEAAKPLSAKDQKKQDEADRKKAKADQEAQAKAARDQAKKDADAAKVAAEQAKRQAKIDAEAAKAAADKAKRQAEADKRTQK
ncbi:MAG TPA: pilus assembly protein N-terminal domain-containing protein [Vicinamibacterales bacterium]|nr:pilus assembly protein N-terminal domain-containing protein [Vicinamibacterales bacterium]